MIIPLGYRFRPSDEHLISGYLLKRVMGLPLPCYVILEKDLYGENAAPSDLFSGIDESNSCYWHSEAHQTKGVIRKTIYVFTKLMKASSNSSRIARRAGCGTWSGQTGPTIIKNFNGQIIGSKKMFTFRDSNMGNQESTSGSASDGGHNWLMHEYSLDGIYKNLAGPNNANNDVVLCKITRSFRGQRTTSDNNSGPDRIPQPVVTIGDNIGDGYCFSSSGTVDHVSQPAAAIRNNGDEYCFPSGGIHEIPQLRTMFPSACSDEGLLNQLPQLAAIKKNIEPLPCSLMSGHKRSRDEGGVPLLEDCEAQINPKKPRNCEDLLGNQSLAQGLETNMDEIFAGLPELERLECSMAKTNNIEASEERLMKDCNGQNGCDPKKPRSDDDSYADFLEEQLLADSEGNNTYNWFEGLSGF